jgi:CRP-like cAMP-binding protein
MMDKPQPGQSPRAQSERDQNRHDLQKESHSKIVKLLRKHERNENDNLALYDYLRNLYFFKHFVTQYMDDGNETMIRKMVSEVEMEEFPADTVIFQEGHQSNDKMYVIITGTVGVYKQKKENLFAGDFDKFTKKVPVAFALGVHFGIPGFRDFVGGVSPSKVGSPTKSGNPSKIMSPTKSGNPSRTMSPTKPGKYGVFRKQFFSKSPILESCNVNQSMVTLPTPTSRPNTNPQPLSPRGTPTPPVPQDDIPLSPSRSPHLTIPKVTLNQLNSSLNNSTSRSPQSNIIDSPRTPPKQKILIPEKNSLLKPIRMQPGNPMVSKSVDLPDDSNVSPDLSNCINEVDSMEDSMYQPMDFKRFGEKVVDLKTGKMFGELALMKSAARNATIIAHENCQLLTLRKSQFDMIKNLYSSEMIFKKEFILQLLPTLMEISSDKYVNEILENLSNVGHLKGYTLTRQGCPGEEIFLVKSGTCKVSLALASGEYMEICEVGPGSIIGEEAIFDPDGRYKFTTVVSCKEAQFLVLRKKFCMKSIPYSSLDYLKRGF